MPKTKATADDGQCIATLPIVDLHVARYESSMQHPNFLSNLEFLDCKLPNNQPEGHPLGHKNHW